MTHEHGPFETWTFPVPPDTLVITTVRIVAGDTVADGVSHDGDNDWQVLDTVNEGKEDEAAVSCLGCLVKTNPHILEVGDLKKGWCAWRNPDGTWERSRVWAWADDWSWRKELALDAAILGGVLLARRAWRSFTAKH